MAQGWKKYTDKLDQGAPQASPSAWEAMQEKMGAYPQLAPKVAKPWWFWVSIIVFPLIALSVFIFFLPTAPFGLSADESNGQQTKQILNETQSQEAIPQPKPSKSEQSTLTDASQSNQQAPSAKAKPNQEERQKKGTAAVDSASSQALSNSTDEGVSSGTPNEIETAPPSSGLEDVVTDAPSFAFKPQKQSPESQEDASKNSVGDPKNTSSTNPLAPADPKAPAGKTSVTDQNKKQENLQDQTLAQEEDAQPDSEPAKQESEIDSLNLAEVDSSLMAAPKAGKKPDFLRPELGFQFSRADWLIAAWSPLDGSGHFALATGLQGNWQRNRFQLSAGLLVGQAFIQENFVTTGQFNRVDSSLMTEIETRQELQITPVWVIDSFFSGRWVNDTAVITVTDTLQTTVYDTVNITTENARSQTRQLAFAELPILAGYRWQTNRWSWQIQAGGVFNQLTSSNLPETGSQSRFGMDVILQPALGFKITDRMGIFTRWDLRYNLLENPWLNRAKLRYGLQLGLSYSFQ